MFYADSVARVLLERSPRIRARVQRLFGSVWTGRKGDLDRAKLADAVFTDKGKREKLNAIVHPHVFEAFDEFVRRYSSDRSSPFLIAEAALIFESKMDKILDYVIVIDAAEDVRIRRVQRRDGVRRQDVERRIGSQMPVAKKLARADFVVKNEGTVADLKKAVRFFINLFRSMS